MSAAPTELFQGVVPFVAVAEARSVRGAARALGITPGAVSKAVTRLEASLGVRLLDRSARAVRLTGEGEAIFAQLREAVARGLAARDLAQHAAERPRGVVRVSAPSVLGRAVLAPALPRLYDRYPELVVELGLTDRRVGFAAEDVDVAVRIGDLGASEARARRVATTRWIVVASPAYLARHGAPRAPADLAAHQCLRFRGPAGRPLAWSFAGRRGRRLAPPRLGGRLVADDGDALLAAAIAGVGLVQAIDFMVRAPVADGRLVEVLGDHVAAGPSIHVLSAPHRGSAPRVRAFVDFAADAIRAATG